MLACVILDSQRRTSITIYDLKGLSNSLQQEVGGGGGSGGGSGGFRTKGLPTVARQTSDFPIARLKFSPYSPRNLVSCGRENVRFWRIKSGHLPACPAILGSFARGTTFTDLAFESSYGMLDDTNASKIVFAATSIGTLLQISYQERNVLCVLKLHNGPINCLAVNEGYAVTGSR